MRGLSKRWQFIVACVGLVILLLCKYFWSFYRFPGVPFGYDAGIYRFLFFTHARGFPPFFVATMPEWAKSHPLGLFFFSTILLKAGIPVDALIGWMWNLFPVVLACVLAWVFTRSSGKRMGLLVLLVSLLSVAQYEGFLMIYWKVFAALLWCTLAFDAYGRKSRWWVFFGMLTVATHQQIGLLFTLAVASSVVVSSVRNRAASESLLAGGVLLFTCVLGLLWYLPNYTRAIGDILPFLFRPTVSLGILAIFCIGTLMLFSVLLSPMPRWWVMVVCLVIGFLLLMLPFAGYAPSSLISFLSQSGAVAPGAFLTVGEYLRYSSPLLVLGMIGLVFLVRRDVQSLWLWAAVWSFLAVVSMFFFYRRFILPLDFFLLPSAAITLDWVWERKHKALHGLALSVIILQALLLLYRMSVIDPHIQAKDLQEFASLARVVEPGAQVVVLDNMAPWVVGFLPEASVSGPGIFDSQPFEVWQQFLFGSHGDRAAFFQRYPVGTYFYATDVFRSFYPPEVQSLLADPCLMPAGPRGLARSTCGAVPMLRP